MEYLSSITDNAKKGSDSNITYVDIMDRPDIVFGAPFFGIGNMGFNKYSTLTHKEIQKYGDKVQNLLNVFQTTTSGTFLRFKTKSKKIAIKAELYRKYDFLRMTLWCSSGFDVYEVENDKYMHITVIAPKSGQNIFCHVFSHNPQNEVVIFLPLYNELIHLYIGTEACIEAVDTVKRPAVAFYGNSITQGASASRSGNCFVNIFSRLTNRETYNFSITSCCRGLTTVASTLGLLNLKAVVIDYSRNASNVNIFNKTYDRFYKEVRKYHNDIPIILMTATNFRETTDIRPYDDVIVHTYEDALRRNENVKLLNQTSLFDSDEYDLCSLDGTHYTDYGMYRIANKLAELVDTI